VSVRRRPFGLPDVAAPTGAESARFDGYAIDGLGVPQPVLMENAGRAVAALTQQLFPRGEVVGLVGTGNNGGDALVALRSLAAWGRPVRAVLVGERKTADLLHGWDIPVVQDADLDESAWGRVLAGSPVLLDGILGTGISGAPRERQAAVIRQTHGSSGPLLALDVPSGVNADTGAVPGTSVLADATICFGHPKLGVLLHPGRARAGRIVAVEIGFPPPDPAVVPFSARVVTPGWASLHRPIREPDTHKNAVGALLIIAGRPGMAGAAVLAARAALRSGAGLVRVGSAEANRSILQTAAPEAVFVDTHDAAALEAAVAASAALVLGPGLGTDAYAATLLETILGGVGDRPLLVDADGLNLLAEGRFPGLGSVDALLTPHPGEAARLLGTTPDAVQRDRPAAALRLAEETGAVTLLKGTPSLVAASGEPLLVDSLGSSALAVGGMGDVLSGVVGSLLAQGLGARTAAALGLFVSGRAAALAGGGPGLLPSDVVTRLPEALLEEGPGETEIDLPELLLDLGPAR
jgi:NAD(P)H-hydrate epimerase